MSEAEWISMTRLGSSYEEEIAARGGEGVPAGATRHRPISMDGREREWVMGPAPDSNIVRAQQFTTTACGADFEAPYTNWRGETRVRKLRPLAVRWGTSQYYQKPGLLIACLDLERGEVREFSAGGFGHETA